MSEGLDRARAATAQIDTWRTTYGKIPELLDPVEEAQLHPTYEVYADILAALDTLQRAVGLSPEEEF